MGLKEFFRILFCGCFCNSRKDSSTRRFSYKTCQLGADTNSNHPYSDQIKRIMIAKHSMLEPNVVHSHELMAGDASNEDLHHSLKPLLSPVSETSTKSSPASQIKLILRTNSDKSDYFCSVFSVSSRCIEEYMVSFVFY